MKIPRILLAAGASGSGKTLITCGMLKALVDRGLKTASFKCGPDYIDPMFHSRVIGTRARNLDTFFTSEKITRAIFQKNAQGFDISVMEGVMGFYDGVGGTTTKASAYDLASVTDTPVDPYCKQQGNECFSGCIHKRIFGIQKRQSHKRRDL